MGYDMTYNTRKGAFGHLRTYSSRISLRYPRRLIGDEYFRLCAKVDLLKIENLHKKRKASFQISLHGLRRLISKDNSRKSPNVPFLCAASHNYDVTNTLIYIRLNAFAEI